MKSIAYGVFESNITFQLKTEIKDPPLLIIYDDNIWLYQEFDQCSSFTEDVFLSRLSTVIRLAWTSINIMLLNNTALW